MELKDYLASSDSESGAEDAAAAKEKYRALLSATGLGKSKGEPVGDMEVTFTSGLSENARGGKVIEAEELEETTIERYARKEKERKQKRKEKKQATREGNPTEERNEEGITREAPTSLGFDDPFFDDDYDAPASRAQEKKEKKRKDKETKAAEAAEAESKRAELALLMMDEDEGLREDGTKLRHFDMKQIVKAEKNKGKKRKRKHGRSDEQDLEGIQDGFEIDVKDPRFAAVYNNHEFAIDPTNPRFVKTKAMNKLMEERRSRARQRNEEGLLM